MNIQVPYKFRSVEAPIGADLRPRRVDYHRALCSPESRRLRAGCEILTEIFGNRQTRNA